jgi:23S rRNA (adenine2503-C2)-methyltransferase
LKESIFSLIYSAEKNKFFDNPYRIKQIFDFIFNTDNYFSIINIVPVAERTSVDGTKKYLFELEDGNCVESVILKDENERYTFCISSQVGCKFSCKFCMTGKMGFIRNLTYSEIISQVLFLAEAVKSSFNIVFMGMGEPLDNYENLSKTINILTDKKYLALSLTRITVSTCGITENISILLKDFPKINLAVSVNSFLQDKREEIMPVTKIYPLKDLINVLYKCFEIYKSRITLEIVLIKGFNDMEDEITAIKKLKREPFMINIIPLNEGSSDKLMKSDEDSIKHFCEKIKDSGFNVTRRYRRGEDIEASCGLLYWKNKRDKM